MGRGVGRARHSQLRRVEGEEKREGRGAEERERERENHRRKNSRQPVLTSRPKFKYNFHFLPPQANCNICIQDQNGGSAAAILFSFSPAINSTMLVGRESLIRLVGKRKRALSSPAAISLLHHNPPADDVIGDASSLSLNKVDSECKVNCPVCGRSIVGSNYAVNSHLGIPVC